MVLGRQRKVDDKEGIIGIEENWKARTREIAGTNRNMMMQYLLF